MIPRALDHHVFCLLTLVSGTFSVLFNGFFKLIIIINPPLGIQNNHILAYVVFWTVLQNDKKYNINRRFLFDLDIGSDFGQRKESKRGGKKAPAGPKRRWANWPSPFCYPNASTFDEHLFQKSSGELSDGLTS